MLLNTLIVYRSYPERAFSYFINSTEAKLEVMSCQSIMMPWSQPLCDFTQNSTKPELALATAISLAILFICLSLLLFLKLYKTLALKDKLNAKISQLTEKISEITHISKHSAKAYKEDTDNYKTRITGLEKSLILKNTEIENLEITLSNSLATSKIKQKDFSHINKLIEDYSVTRNVDKLKKKYLKKIERVIDKDSESEYLISKIESELEKTSPGIIAKLQDKDLHLKKMEYKLLLFSTAGFSRSSIAFLLDCEANAVSNRKNRLRKKLEKNIKTDNHTIALLTSLLYRE